MRNNDNNSRITARFFFLIICQQRYRYKSNKILKPLIKYLNYLLITKNSKSRLNHNAGKLPHVSSTLLILRAKA